MRTDEIVKLSREAIELLLKARDLPVSDWTGQEQRRRPRWPFPGTVELESANGDGRTRWFATCSNLSQDGIGIVADTEFRVGQEMNISVHLPEASYWGRAIVRHCTERSCGYVVGLQFQFE